MMSVGDKYSITSPAVEGYTADRRVVTGDMPEQDTWEYVRYTKNPVEETTEPTGTDPTETDPTDPTYDLTALPDDQTPLANVELEGEHTCCIMHFLLMLLSMIVLAFYTSDRKKLQESIFDLKRALKNEGVDVDSDNGKDA